MKKHNIFTLLVGLSYLLLFNSDNIKLLGSISPFYLALILAYVYILAFGKYEYIRTDGYLKLLFGSHLAFTVLMFASDLLNNSLETTLNNLISIWTTVLLLAVSRKSRNVGLDKKVLFNLFFIGCQIHTMIGLLETVAFVTGIGTNGILGTRYGFRVTGLFMDPNIFSFAVLMGFGVSLARLFENPRKRTKLAYFILVLLDFVVIFLTGSRTALIAMAILVVLYAFMRIRSIVLKGSAVVIFLLLLSLSQFVIVGLLNSFSENIIGREADILTDVRFTTLWVSAMEAFWEHPILGSGYDSVVNRIGLGAHNFILTMLADRGILGTLVYFLPFLVFFKERKKMKNENIIMLLAYLISSLGISNWIMRVPYVLLWLAFDSKDDAQQHLAGKTSGVNPETNTETA